jgi:hypothetical protein
MVKQRPDHVVVSIHSKVEDFVDIICATVSLKKTTWDEVLVMHGIQMDPDKHCLKSINGKEVILPNEKVSVFIGTFKKNMAEYKVKLVALRGADRAKLAEKQKKKRVNKSPKKPAFVRKPVAGPSSAMNTGAYSTSPTHGQQFENHKMGFPPPRFPEDEFMDANGDEANHNLGGGQNVYQDFDDSASQDSQDSQNELEDIKAAAINRLIKGTPNSVMHSVRDEMRLLKKRPNFMKIVRYLPLTVSFLDHMFQDS